MLRQVTALEALEATDVPHCRVRWHGGPDDVAWFGRPYFVVEQLGDGGVVGMGGGCRLGRRPHRAERTRWGVKRWTPSPASTASTGRTAAPTSASRSLSPPMSPAGTASSTEAADPDALGDVPALRQLLLERMPTAAHVGLFHGDFQFSNLWYSSAGELRAVLDWELCGIGATLNDVGWVATFNDPDAWDHDGAVPDGMPRVDDLVARYADAWGEPLHDLAWFRALAAYKFAIITGFNLALHRRGKRPDALWERIGQSIGSLQSRARQLLTASDG